MKPGLLPLWAAVVVCECVLLFLGQRRLFWLAEEATGSRRFAYFLAAPGTALHEASHAIACYALGVRVGKINFFRPSEDGDSGQITLGYVQHAESDPLRGALIAIAPVLLVPPLLVLAAVVLLGGLSLSYLEHALSSLAIWRLVLYGYIALSAGQAAFPSPGDHVGVVGGIMLGLLAAGLVWATGSANPEALARLLSQIAAILAVPAACAGISLAGLRALARRRARS